jgi:TonB-dependent receptor
LLLAPASLLAQDPVGSVSGLVVSTWNGTPLPTVTVTVRGTTLAVQTDMAGRYTMNNVPPGDQVLRFSKPGYASAVVTDVRVIPGQTTTVNGNLRPEFFEMEEFEVMAEEFTEQTEKILFERQQAGALMDAIGSEQFSKLGAGDAGGIVARVTGVSVVGGKYAVVRGLSDRYTRTLLNGVEVPSADPYRMSPQLDLFPSAMIDNVAVSKTFTPDQPGGTGGGTIDITTKSFPDKPFFKASYGNSYNPNSNLKKNFLADPDSSMDMFALPSGPRALNPDLYGLKDAPPDPGTASSRETQARANDRAAKASARQQLLQELGTANFAGTRTESPLNSSFDASGGATVPVFGQNLGMFAGINYKRNFHLIEDAIVRRYNADGSPKQIGHETRGNINTDYGANVNLGYALGPQHQLGFNFMLAHSVDEEARDAEFAVESPEGFTLKQWQLRHTEREILNYAVSGKHELPPLADSKVDWVIGIANTSQDEPDNRFMNYYLDETGRASFGDASLPTPQFPARYFRQIEEDSFNYRVDWTLPLSFLGFLKEDSKIKAGFFSSSTARDFREQYFAYNRSDGFDPARPNSYLNDPAYLRYVADHLGGIRTNYNFQRYVGDTFSSPYTASLDVTAGYLMQDIAVTPWLRLIGGARLEHTSMIIDADSGASELDQRDLLPAASAVITLWTNLNMRLGYGETVARPSFREKAPVANFLPDNRVIAFGNKDLQMTAIQSYDARLEWFPAPGDVVSVGVFYKELERPIELYSETLGDDIVTWINRTNEPATVMGVEFEVRKGMEFLAPYFKGLSLGANVTLIESSVTLTDDELTIKRGVVGRRNTPKTRPLYDQSPYIINLDMTYAHPTSGTTLAIGSNLTGERLVIAKSQGPDVYEHPPVSLDISISQKFWKRWSARFAVRNVLDPEFRQTYGADPKGDIYQSFHRGRTFSLSLSAEF